jgi:nitrite reductase/ring-hydroxylating ferredoxin subunit
METKVRELTAVIVCPMEELEPGERKLVQLDGVEIAVINVGGNLYAFRNACPHQGAPMVYGSVSGTMLPSDPQQLQYGCHDEIIRCPLHGWGFDLKTGKSTFLPDNVSIKMYEVKKELGSIVLYTRRNTEQIKVMDISCDFPCGYPKPKTIY